MKVREDTNLEQETRAGIDGVEEDEGHQERDQGLLGRGEEHMRVPKMRIST